MLGAIGCGLSNPSGGSRSPGSGGPDAGVLTASSKSVIFGSVPVKTSTSQLVTLTDTGESNVIIRSVSATGPGFSASGGSEVTITSGQSVTISVNFEPTEPGNMKGKLSISSNASESLLRIELSGTGLEQENQHAVTLRWQASTSQVIGYFIYRGAAAGYLAKLNSSEDSSTDYTDSTVAGGQTYVYAVTSVNSNHVESAPSDPISVTIPSP